MKPLLLIAITILAVGCGEKNESITETKPELNIVPDEKLIIREGIWYLKGADTPFTGKVYKLHPNGQKKGEATAKDGKRDGIAMTWYENGQKEFEEYYKDGKLEGPSNAWYENGQKKGELNAKDGKIEGLFVEWHENGQKKRETTFKIGKRVGLWLEWYDNGQMKKEINYKDGEEVEGSAKYWNRKGEPVDSLEEAQK